MTRTNVVGWTLAAPALVVIAVFFAVPVVLGLALSLTDFDLYALKSIAACFRRRTVAQIQLSELSAVLCDFRSSVNRHARNIPATLRRVENKHLSRIDADF